MLARRFAHTVAGRIDQLCAGRQTFVSRARRLLVCAAAVGAIAVGDAQSQTPGILFVQSTRTVLTSSSSTVTGPYNSAQVAGDLNVVVVTWNDTSAQVQTVADTTGNIYQRAIGPTVRSSTASQSLYYAINRGTAAAGANTVTVTFTAAATTPELRVAEYSGIDPLQPVDVTAGTSGNSASSSSGSVTTLNANDLLIGANWASGVTTAAGASYTSRMITSTGDILEDRVVTVIGSYAATAPVSPSGGWIMQLAAFRAAGSPQADLTLTKTHSGNFTQGQTGATYTLTVRNSGAWPTAGTVTVVDTLPAGLTATALGGTGWTCSVSTATCTRSSALTAGSTYPAITLTVSVAANAAASLTNTATVSGGAESNTANDLATDVTAINVPIPDLTLTKTHTGSFTQGQVGAKYTLTATNSGTGSTSGVVTVRDTLPPGLTATALSGTSWSCTLATLTCTRSSVLAPGSSYAAITLTVNVAATAAASLTNAATVSGGGQTNTSNDAASDVTAIIQLADLTLTKSHAGTFTQGQLGATYGLNVRNSGGGPTSGTVTVSDTLPSGLTATAIGGTGWTCSQPAGACTRSDVLAAGASYPLITLTVSVASNAPASVTNTATVAGGGELVTTNNGASDLTAIAVAAPDIAVATTHGAFTQGQTGATYGLTVSNVGAGPTSGTVTVGDSVPAGLLATGISGSNWSCTQPAGPCARSDSVAPGSAYPSITLTVNVASNASPTVTNTATVTIAGDVNTGNNTASDVATITQLADLAVNVSHSGAFTQGQISAVYGITVGNAGSGQSTGSVTVTDSVPPGLTATSIGGSGWTCVLATLTCTRSDALVSGASYPSITLTVDVSSTAAPSVTNIATVAGGGQINFLNDTALDQTTIVVVPDLVVTSTHTGSFAQGQSGARYTLTLTNTGAGSTSGAVTVADVLPAGLTATGLSGAGWTCLLDTLACTRADLLGPGAAFPSIDLILDVAADAAPSVANVATVSGGGEFNTANDAANDVTAITPPPDLVVGASHAGSFVLGQVGASYTLTVSNTGAGNASGMVTVADVLPPGLTASGLTGSGWTCVLEPLSCTRVDGLPSGGAYPAITLTVAVGQDAAATVTNTVVVGGGGEVNLGNDTATDVTNVVPPPDLRLAKAHVDPFTQGQTGAVYSIVVTNAGAGPTSGVVSVTDALPAGLTATGIGGVGWSCTIATLSCTRSDVLAGGGSYPPVAVTVNVASTAAASAINTAIVSGGGDANTANNTAADATNIDPLADLALAVTHPGTFAQGQTGATYTLTVTNAGAGPTAGPVTVTDTLPAGLTATAVDGFGWTCTVAPAACLRGDALAPGASYPLIVVTVSVASNAAASVTNVASVGGGGDANSSNNAASDVTGIVQLPDLTVAVTHAGSFAQGQVGAAYSLVVRNAGPGPTASMVTVVDTLPDGLTATAFSGSGWNCTLDALTCSRGDALGAGVSYPPITLIVTVAPDAPASVNNTAVVGGGGETNVANDSASDATTIVSPPDLSMVAAHTGSFTQGQTAAQYTLTVTNVGHGPTSGAVSATDTLPSGLTATAISGAGWNCTVSSLTCSRSDVLAAGTSYAAMTLTVDVAGNAPASVTNTAVVTASGDMIPANNTATDPTAIVQVPDLTVGIAHAGAFTQGQIGATYTLTVANAGSGPTSGAVTLANTLPVGLTATAFSGTGWTCTLETRTCTRSDVLSGGSSYPPVALTVDVASDAPVSVTNAATVSGGGETTLSNDSGADVTAIVQVPDLTVISTHAGSFVQGQSAVYTLVVANMGAGPTTSAITIADSLPTGLNATAISGAGWSCVLNSVTCTRNDVLAAGGSYPPLSLAVTPAADAVSPATNTVVVSGGGEMNVTNNTGDDPTTIVSPADLTVMSAHLDSFTQGQGGASYTLNVTNAGAGQTTGTVTLADTLPASLTASAMAGAGWTCDVSATSCARSDVLPGGSSYPAITLTVNVANAAPASVTNTVAVSGGGEVNTSNDTASDATTIAAAPDLAIGIAHGGTFTQGQSAASYTLTVSNTGAGSTSGPVTVVDTLPGSLSATGLSGAGWTCTLGTLTCTRSDALESGASYSAIVLTLNVAANAPATVTNTAVASGGGEVNTANDSASDVTLIVQQPDMALVVTHTGSFLQGQSGAVYTLTVTNVGPGPTATAVTVVDVLPGGLTATAFSGNGWACTLATLTCMRNDSLVSGASFPIITLTVNVALNAPATIANTATVSGGGEANTANDIASDVTTVTASADLTIAITDNGPFSPRQTNAIFALTVSNIGPGPTTSAVTVQDALPLSLSAAGLTGTGWNCVLATLTCTRSDILPAGTSYPVITLVAAVVANALGNVTDTATVSGGGETNLANDTASDVVRLGPVFPVRYSSNNRYLVDQNNVSFPILGRTAWFVISLPVADYQTFIDDSVARGYTAIEMHVLDHDGRGYRPPFNGNNDAPFLKRLDGTSWNGALSGVEPDFTTPNEAYWTFVDTFLSYCESKGILVLMFPAYTGFSGGSQGWMKEMTANGATRMNTFGAWIASRYRNQKNLVWMAGGDYGQGAYPYTLSQRDVEAAMLSGMQSVANQQSVYFSAEWVRNSIATDQADFGSQMTLNGVYSNSQQINSLGQRAYGSSPVRPAFVLEEPYDQEGTDGNGWNVDATQPVRRFQWWGWLSTIGGYVSGNGYVWPFVSPAWQAHLDTQGSRDMARLNAFLQSISWQDLVPSGLTGLKTLVTAGLGNIFQDNYVASAATPSGSLLLAYVGPGHTGTITIDMTAMGGTTQARWFDPTSGAYTTISGSPFPATGTRTFTPPGANTTGYTDWVLRLDATVAPDVQPPSAPTNLAVSSASLNQIGLTWSPSTDNVAVSGYRIARNGTVVGVSTTTSFADVGLTPETAYTYTVTAFDGAGNLSGPSLAVIGTTTTPTPDLTLGKTHIGGFTPGQLGALYTLAVTNAGNGATTAPVTVIDTLPASLTATGLSGSGWTCTLASLSCTRSDALAAGGSYPVVTLTVNVSSSAPPSVTNSAVVSGGGETNTANDSASDVTAIGSWPSPPVFVTEAHFAVDQNSTGLNRATLSLTASGTNTLLLAALHVEFDGGDTNWIATDNGVAGTQLVNTDGYSGGAGNHRFRIWYWVNPPAGNNSVIIQNTYSGSNEIAASAVLLSNVNQSVPFGAITIDTSSLGRSSESETVASTIGDLVVHAIADAYFVRGNLGLGETSSSIANDGLQKSSPGDGDASLWISTKPGSAPTTTVSSSGWPSSPAPAPSPMTGVAIIVHSAGADVQSPTAPGSLAAASSVGQVNVNWAASSDNVGVTGYFVERCQGAGCSVFAQLASTPTAAFTDTAVTMGSIYGYRARATDAAGNLSGYSNTGSVTVPDTEPPSAPSNLAASTTTSSQIALVWSASTDNLGVAGYRVFRNSGILVGTTSQTSFVETGLIAGTGYAYLVVAFDAAGNTSLASDTIFAFTVPLQPATPTLVQHVAGGMDNHFATTLTLSLPHPSGAGNALILGIRFNAAGSISGVGDNLGNAWFAGPTVANVSGSIGTRVALFYALNVAPGTQTIAVAFNGLAGPTGSKAFPQAVVSEFCNVAALAALDGQNGNASSAVSGTIMSSAAGDLIYQWGVVVSSIDAANGAQFNGSGITAGNGFTLLSADLQAGSADQYLVQAAAGGVTPAFSPSGSETWASVAMALKAAPGGTPAPTGIRIVHVQHTMLAWPGHSAPMTLAFPSSGNLLVGSFTGDTPSIAGVTDSAHNTWLSAGVSLDGSATSAQVVYVPGAVTSPSLNTITVNLTAPCSSTGCALVLYDITGATASPFDKSTWATGTQAAPGVVSMASLTPSASNELMLAAGAVSAHTINSVSGAGLVLDSQVNAFDDHGASGTTTSRLDVDNAFAHAATSGFAPMTFSFRATTQAPGGVGSWTAVAVAFYGLAPALDTTAPSVPANLSGVGVSPTQINLTWSPSADDVGVAGYRIYRNGVEVATSAANGFADTSLSPQTSYAYSVSAVDAAGNVSALTAPTTASTTFGDVTAPSVPGNLQSSNVTSTSLTLTWNSSSDDTGVAGYRVFRNGVLLVTTSATIFADTGLAASTTYSYSVSAFDAAGNASAQSTPLNATTAQAPLTPPAFVKLKEARVTANSNSISTGAFASPVTGGNLIAVWIWYNSSTQKVASMTDTAGNTYAVAVGPTTGTSAMAGWRQELWYAKNVVGGSNLSVTATFTGTFNAEKSITAHEYSGLDQLAPLDVTAAAATTVANASTGVATTRFANELIFAGALFQGSGSAGSGFTRRSSMASNVSEDKVVSSVGAFAGLFTNTAQAAIVQMAAFKAAGQ